MVVGFWFCGLSSFCSLCSCDERRGQQRAKKKVAYHNGNITGGINAGLLATVWVHAPPADDGSGSMMHDHLADVPPGKLPPTFTVASVLELEAVLEKIG